MTNNELLAGFLDRSLSEEELLEFEARKNSSPEFAAEVRELLTVENLLTQAAPRVRYPVEFLAGVESTVAAKIAAAAVTTGIVATLAKTTWAWIAGGTAAVVLTGGAIFMALDNEATPVAAPTTSVHVQPVDQPTVAEDPLSVSETVSSSQPQPVAVAKTQSTPLVEQISAETNSPDPALEQILADYEKCKSSSDHIRCSQIALVLGRSMRDNARYGAARQYFEAALTHARALRLAEYEMNAYGELGILARLEGNSTSAIEAFKRAIEVGLSQQRNVARWTSELESLERR